MSSNHLIKIKSINLSETNKIHYNIFGDWINKLDILSDQFNKSKPFSYIVIDNFFENYYANSLFLQFPNIDSNWHKYFNPIEIKYTLDNLDVMSPDYKNLFYILCGNQIIEYIKKISNIDNLEYDPYLHGAGLHYYPNGGKLDMHIDYGIHPLSNKERRLNLIIYMNKDWDENWGGDIEFWDNNMENCCAKIAPLFNRAILFETSDKSWHGFPTQIICPSDQGRKSIAIYWVSDQRPNAKPRFKAKFVSKPSDIKDEKIEKLRNIRVNRRITENDLNTIYPNWIENYRI